MQDTRISLRFRMDNERDMRAWTVLEAMSTGQNISKNSAVIDALIYASEQRNTEEKIAEQIADLVVKKLGSVQSRCEAGDAVDTIKNSDTYGEVSTAHADEPKILGEDALDFLGMLSGASL